MADIVQKTTRPAHVRLGTAGWAIPRRLADRFPIEGSGLERYAARFNAAEINSTFYRPSRPATYARWVASTPDDFRFSLKAPKAITHERKLVDCADPIQAFLDETAALGPKRGALLVQLPPSLGFDATLAGPFFELFRTRYEGPLACEPRHPSWFEPEAGALLEAVQVARVAADPARVAQAGEPGGWPGLVYVRLHGSPRVYWSAYDGAFLDALAARLAGHDKSAETWCVFDNTASGAAAANALELQTSLGDQLASGSV